MLDDQRKCRGVAELALAREQVRVGVRQELAGIPIRDLVQAHIRMPGPGVLNLPNLQPEHLVREIEEAVHDLLEREVFRHDRGVDAVRRAPQLGIEIAEVPRLDHVVAGLGEERGAHLGQLVGGHEGHRRHEPVVEAEHGGRRLRHALVHRDVGPRREAEDLGHAPAHGQGLRQHRLVGLERLRPLLELESLAEIATLRELHEWDDLGVLE